MAKPFPNPLDESSLGERHGVACAYLRDFCVTAGLPDLVGNRGHWAIVGGAVRDALLAHDVSRVLWEPWNDLDIAIAYAACDRQSRRSGPGSETSLLRNSFGGWRIQDAKLGTLDLWLMTYSAVADTRTFWKNYLGTVDYSVNAVAFAWPECRLFLHPNWMEHLRSRTISRIGRTLPRPAVQPVRAIALAVRLELLSREPFSFADNVRQNLAWLAADASREHVTESLEYLDDRLKKRRWDYAVLDRLVDEVRKLRVSHTFAELLEERFHVRLPSRDARVKAKKSMVAKSLFNSIESRIAPQRPPRARKRGA
jgi:hypothetical protein